MHAIFEPLKRNLPTPARRVARFIYRLPVHFRSDLSYQRCAEQKLGHDVIVVADGISMRVPDHAIANSVFRSMAFESRAQAELRAFLKLAKDRTSLCDAGASGGFFSALFACSRPASRILSIEVDEPTVAVLTQTRERNVRPGCTWAIDARGIADAPGEIEVVSSGYGGAFALHENEVARTEHHAAINQVSFPKRITQVDRLATICGDHGLTPDLLKIDIESFEYELVMSSLEFLGDLKPHIAFELHVDKLRERGKDPLVLLQKLAGLGYKLAWTGRPVTDMLSEIAGDGCTRAAITAT